MALNCFWKQNRLFREVTCDRDNCFDKHLDSKVSLENDDFLIIFITIDNNRVSGAFQLQF